MDCGIISDHGSIRDAWKDMDNERHAYYYGHHQSFIQVRLTKDSGRISTINYFCLIEEAYPSNKAIFPNHWAPESATGPCQLTTTS